MDEPAGIVSLVVSSVQGFQAQINISGSFIARKILLIQKELAGKSWSGINKLSAYILHISAVNIQPPSWILSTNSDSAFSRAHIVEITGLLVIIPQQVAKQNPIPVTLHWPK